jgi:cell division protein FtsB
VRRPASDASAKRIRAVRQKKLSGRATVLSLLLLVMALAYAYPVRVYLAQQAEINRLQASQAAQRARIQALQDQLAKWKDPAYVIAQAKERLHYVYPGETAYVVVEGQDQAGTSGGGSSSNSSWFNQLLASITAADSGTGH